MITAQQFLETIRHGLPGCEIDMFDSAAMCASVIWCGETFDISADEVDGFPVFLVTTGAWELNERTAKVLDCLDSVLPEVLQSRRPWPDYRSLLRRLRELADEGGDDESIDPV